MAESEDGGKGCNGEIEFEVSGGGDTLAGVLRDVLAGITADGSAPLGRRIRVSLSTNVPRLKDASRNSAQALLSWARQGSPLRALLVISVGTITLLALTGLMVFMFFFVVATFNAVIISAFMSLAAAGGFLALFFMFITAIYVGALSVAAFVISTVVVLAIFGVMIATGWVGFICILWIAAKKSLDVTKQSIRITGLAISSYSSRFNPHDVSLKSENEKIN